MTAHSVFDAAKTTSDPYDDRPGPWYDMKKVREIEDATGIAFREVEPSTAALFPIMSVGYRHNEEIPKLRKAGVQQLIIGIPWGMIAPHEEQAKSNHGQTLRRLAERGGLGVCEAVAVLQNRRWEKMPGGTAHHQLAGLLTAYNARIARDEAEAEYRATGGF